tara:strand:+ start:216 stop:617 length:402 start_codon:yes stop_codon:yes gene_type:complete
MTDFKQLWIDIDEKKQKDIDRMAELRSRKKPAKMTGVHSSILELEADHEWSYTNLKKWIETQEGVAKAAGQTERSKTSEMSNKKREAAMRTRLDAQSYIRIIKRYIRTGDWDGMYYGPNESKLTKWKIVAPAG